MPQVSLPKQLRKLLAGSPMESPTIALADTVGSILGENFIPFFPAYTDHGTRHVEFVLDAIVRLVPEEVWAEGLLQPADAAVISCATMLHDLAMHVREAGFVELVSEDTRFLPRPWFAQDHPDRPLDAPWPELWASFQREARHFGTSQLELIFGPTARRVPAVAYEAELCTERWTIADRLLIGEFLRRHHARLAHEIAIYGIPGLDEDTFPRLVDKVPQLADAIGAVARSHNERLRDMAKYLEYLEPGSKRPSGAVLMYDMALLRIADYLQVQADRAPVLLLRLKRPQSPLSVEEWNKHGAVSSISWDHRDPMAIFIGVSPMHGLRTHLALRDLFTSLQNELDTTNAVLSEAYPAAPLAALRLTRARVLTNLGEPSLHEQLPYIPVRAALRSDADLFRLVIRDLYGNQPAVAGRELVQNAVDAVRARWAWENHATRRVPRDDLRKLPADIRVTLEEKPGGKCVLRVADYGIGMQPEVIINFYLQAGASFGPTPADFESLDRDETLRTMKAGRFGVGVFAAFLLGQSLQVTTRHVTARRGVSFRASINEELVELTWTAADVPVGTEVTIPFDASVIPRGRRERTPNLKSFLAAIASFYRLARPSIAFSYQTDSEVVEVPAPRDVPSSGGRLPDAWRGFCAPGFDSILWLPRGRVATSNQRQATVTHNGVLIGPVDDDRITKDTYAWTDSALAAFVSKPSIAVFDSRHTLGVALHRYSLTEPTLPFEDELLSSIGSDMVAHALAAGPRGHPLQLATESLSRLSFSPIFSRTTWMPFLPSLLHRYASGRILVLWRLSRPFRQQREIEGDTAFLARRGTPPWRQFPNRAILGMSDGSGEDDASEYRLWGHTRSAASYTLRDWEERLSPDVSTTVLVRTLGTGSAGDGREVSRVAGARSHETDWGASEWQRVATEPGEGAGVFVRSLSGNDQLDAGLIDAARGLLTRGERSVIILTLFENIAATSEIEEQVAEPWIKTLGGGLARGAREREAVADAVSEKYRHMRPLLSKWRRSL